MGRLFWDEGELGDPDYVSHGHLYQGSYVCSLSHIWDHRSLQGRLSRCDPTFLASPSSSKLYVVLLSHRQSLFEAQGNLL